MLVISSEEVFTVIKNQWAAIKSVLFFTIGFDNVSFRFPRVDKEGQLQQNHSFNSHSDQWCWTFWLLREFLGVRKRLSFQPYWCLFPFFSHYLDWLGAGKDGGGRVNSEMAFCLTWMFFFGHRLVGGWPKERKGKIWEKVKTRSKIKMERKEDEKERKKIRVILWITDSSIMVIYYQTSFVSKLTLCFVFLRLWIIKLREADSLLHLIITY